MSQDSPSQAPVRVAGDYYCPDGKNNINYVIGVVELYEAPNLQSSIILTGSTSSELSYTYQYPSGYPTSNASKKTYYLPPILSQTILEGDPPPAMSVKVSNSQNPNQSKSGSVNPTKTKGLDETSHDLNVARVQVLKSSSQSSDYFILIFVKVVNTVNRTLIVNTSGKTISCTYGTQTPSTSSENVVAVALLASSKDQYDKVVVTDNEGNSYTTTFNYSSPNTI